MEIAQGIQRLDEACCQRCRNSSQSNNTQAEVSKTALKKTFDKKVIQGHVLHRL